MALINMQKELLGDIPGIDLPYAKTLLQEALGLIYDEQRWSFQAAENGWLTPGLLGGLPGASGGFGSGNFGAGGFGVGLPGSVGTISVAPYATAIVGDAAATANWAAMVGRPFITEMQIRIGSGSLYNIVAYDSGSDPANSPNFPFATLTIDRPWMEPAQTNAGFMIYQAYFAVPVASFKKFTTMRDPINNAWINFWKGDQAWLSRIDPQRLVFDVPRYAVPYKTDQRAGSATFGNMMYELWPHPLSVLPYSYGYLCGGQALTLGTDTVPYPLNEDMVKWRAKEVAFLWKEAQKGDGMERGSGADWRFLAQEARAQYMLRLKAAKLLDVGLGDLYWSKFERTNEFNDGYETLIGTLNVGT